LDRLIGENAKNTSCRQLAAIDSSLKTMYLAANKTIIKTLSSWQK